MYDGNGSTGGSVPAVSTGHNYNTVVTVLGNTNSLVKTGYTFAGWNTATDGSGTVYVATNTFTIATSDVTLYAQWTINSYNVSYDGNGSTGGSVPAGTIAYNYNTAVTVLGNTNTFVKTGYTFAGWNTAADGSSTAYIATNTFNMVRLMLRCMPSGLLIHTM